MRLLRLRGCLNLRFVQQQQLSPKIMSITAPSKPMITDSHRNMVSIVLLFMPKALRMPISRVRSISETIVMFIMPMPATSSEMAAMPAKNYCSMLKMLLRVPSTAVEDVTETWLLKCSTITLLTSVIVALSLFFS
jgi:hypothetical protein